MTPAQEYAIPACDVLPDRQAAETEFARRIAAKVRRKPDMVLGLATGNSMIGVYRVLVAMHRKEGLSFAAATSFNLDEYCGLPAGHPASFASYMREHFFAHVDMPPGSAHLPDENACADYEAAIAKTGIDLQILGIGRNGHIGFNEPGAPVTSRTRVVELAAATRTANQRDFPAGEAVPARAVTMGIATILAARSILLLATGPAKAEALAAALEGPVTPQNPASFLRLHADVTVICDRDAATLLSSSRKTADG
ncbi:glucosamine-6-phosphate deaminase [Rhodobium gokarnense]|uniref:Glucosamine-6-phosphate deaminase n=1 Tax=Rhodobium gokarnense TaxID=364296 RepID=A0ABT3HGV8_9HYPH|nr:glucosamine-6-phosphate deaminase [Rhodobium gokarnense]MCW2309628.1 glucosamine-6-phosphate deaminase [Rhodobium gokarnense]